MNSMITAVSVLTIYKLLHIVHTELSTNALTFVNNWQRYSCRDRLPSQLWLIQCLDVRQILWYMFDERMACHSWYAQSCIYYCTHLSHKAYWVKANIHNYRIVVMLIAKPYHSLVYQKHRKLQNPSYPLNSNLKYIVSSRAIKYRWFLCRWTVFYEIWRNTKLILLLLLLLIHITFSQIFEEMFRIDCRLKMIFKG